LVFAFDILHIDLELFKKVQERGGLVAYAVDAFQFVGFGGNHAVKRAKSIYQTVGGWIRVGARDNHAECKFQNLGFVKGFKSIACETLAQFLAPSKVNLFVRFWVDDFAHYLKICVPFLPIAVSSSSSAYSSRYCWVSIYCCSLVLPSSCCFNSVCAFSRRLIWADWLTFMDICTTSVKTRARKTVTAVATMILIFLSFMG